MVTKANPSVFIVEDELLVAEHLRFLLQTEGYLIVGAASSGKEALDLFKIKQADIVLCDVNIRGGMTGIEVMEHLRLEYDFAMIYITAFSDQNTINQCVNTGPEAYLVKPFTDKQLLATITMAWISYQKRKPVVQKTLNNLLSNREKEIVLLLAKGYTSRGIGEALFISELTVQTHRKNILQKLNFNNTQELISYAFREGII